LLIGKYSSSVTGLAEKTTYYLRAYATNSWGTAYGPQITFKTPNPPGPPITDIDGNVYNTVVIGNQTWMTQDLKVTHYRNGDPIPTGYSNSAWSSLNTGAYYTCPKYYTNGEQTTIKLYNWYAAVDSRILCPVGWHIPSSYEWNVLTDYLGGAAVAGPKLKEAGPIHWDQTSVNVAATNESGFTAFSGGYREAGGSSQQSLAFVHYWASDVYPNYSMQAWDFNLNSSSDNNCYESTNDKRGGLSIRCVKDYVLTNGVSNITSNTPTSAGTAMVSGNIIGESSGGSITERGFYWKVTRDNCSSCISTGKSKDVTGGIGSFSCLITGLKEGNATYYVKAYAINNLGIYYGNDVIFTTGAFFPTSLTHVYSSVTSTTAKIQTYVDNDGGASISEVGVCWSTSPNPTTSNSKITVNNTDLALISRNKEGGADLELTGLTPNTTYYVRSYATNSVGTGYGEMKSFKTDIALLQLTTYFNPSVCIVDNVTYNGLIQVQVQSDGGAAIIEQGICLGLNPNPTTDCNKIIVRNCDKLLSQKPNPTANCTKIIGKNCDLGKMTGLIPNTVYHARAYAINSLGTAYGNDVSFTP